MRSAVATATEAAIRVREVVRGLGALARLKPGSTEPVDLHAALEVAIDLTAFELSSRARLERNYAPVPPVVANFARLTQAFIHVLMNAAQAIPGQAPATNKVVVRTRPADDRCAVIEILDTGEGIEPADLPHIFEPFFTSKPRPVSAGLGLSIAEGTITTLGGSIAVESEVGRGTLVRITLPVSDKPDVAPPPARTEPRPCQSILVVAKDPMRYPFLAGLVESARTAVAFARPEEALDLLAQGESVDLVVCDRALGWSAESTFIEEVERAAPHMSSRVLEISVRA